VRTGARRRLVNAAAAVLGRAGVDSPRLDAEVLLASVLGVRRLDLLLEWGGPAPAAARRRFAALVRARERHEPVAYLTGTREFFGRGFAVDRRVLVPRPETEVLAEAAIAWLRKRPAGERRVLDLCTGSGCLAVTIGLEVPGAVVVGTDSSEGALEVARGNAAALGATGVTFARGDLWEAVEGGGTFDLVVSNPPYVAASEEAEVDRSVREFEPREAWLAGEDPIAFHRRIIAGARRRLAADGALMMEVGSGSGAVRGLLSAAFPAARVRVIDDLAGRPRVVVGELAPDRRQ
jgi:release factor glutamine methyltransferase